MAKVTVSIEGYGEIKVKRPKKLNKETFMDALAETVAETMNLVSPQEQGKRFHPVLGIGGHRGH